MEILVLGWKTVRDFRSTCGYPSSVRAETPGIHLPRGSRVVQASRLQSLATLADRLRQS
jgi:hypothetical protein